MFNFFSLRVRSSEKDLQASYIKNFKKNLYSNSAPDPKMHFVKLPNKMKVGFFWVIDSFREGNSSSF